MVPENPGPPSYPQLQPPIGVSNSSAPPIKPNGEEDSRPEQAVLQTPELLEAIISCVEFSCLPRAARVSRFWSEFALNDLWRSSSDPRLIVQTLAPMVHDEETGCLRFAYLPLPSGWMRFDTYAQRVRTLRWTTFYGVLDDSVFNELGRSRIRQAIFPNLHTLEWYYSTEFAVIFMHPGLKSLFMRLPPSSLADLLRPGILQDVAWRTPNLTSMNIASDWTVYPGTPLEEELISFWKALPYLEEVWLGSASLTSAIGEALGRLEHLRVLHASTVALWEPDQILNPDICKPNLPALKDAFPKLESLFLSASVAGCTQLLRYFSPTSLNNLELWPANTTQDDRTHCIHELFSLLADKHPSISRLHFGRMQAISNSTEETRHTTVNFNILKPLLRLSNLTHFDISYNYPFQLSNADIETFASHLPLLEVLNLNSQPDIYTESDFVPNVSLEALLPIAQYCPNMWRLALSLDATLPCPRLDPQSPTFEEDIPVFRNLSVLGVGVSMIQEGTRTEEYLARLLPSTCVIKIGEVVGRHGEGSFPVLEIVDNVVRHGRVADPSLTDPNLEGVRELLKLIQQDDEVEATTIATVGEKGYDGFIYAVKK